MRMDDPGVALPAWHRKQRGHLLLLRSRQCRGARGRVGFSSMAHRLPLSFRAGCVCVGVRHASSIAQELPLASDHESPHQRRCGVIVSRPFRRVGWKLCTQGRVSPPCHVGGKKSSCCHAPFTRLPAAGGCDRADDIRSSVWIRATVTSVSGSSTFRAGAGVAPPSLTGCSGNYQGFSQLASRSFWDSDSSTQLCSLATRSPSVRCGHRRSAVRLEAARARSSPQCWWLRDRSGRSRDVPARWVSSLLHKTPDARTLEYGDRLESLSSGCAPIRRGRPSSTRRSIRLKPNCSPDVAALR